MPPLRRRRPTRTGTSAATGGSGGGFDADTNTWVSAVTGHGGTVSPTSKGFVDTLIKAIKADSTLCPSGNLNDTLDQMWLIANFDTTGSSTTTDAQALTSIVNPNAATALATPNGTWSSNTLGWQSSTNGYLDLGYNPTSFNSSTAKFSQNSAAYGVYGLTSRAASDAKLAMGAYNGGTINQLSLNAVSSAAHGINDTGGLDSCSATGGLSMLIRSSSASGGGNAIITSSGGIITKTTTTGSAAPSNLKFFAFARNNATTADAFETIKIGLVFAGGRSGTNAAYAAALFTPVQAYMTSLTIAV